MRLRRRWFRYRAGSGKRSETPPTQYLDGVGGAAGQQQQLLTNSQLVRRFVQFLKPTRRYGLLSVSLMLAGVVLQLPLPLISARIIDQVFQQRRVEVLAPAMGLLFGIAVILLVARFGQNYYTTVFTERTKAYFMEALMDKALRMSARAFRSRPSGYMLARLRDDVFAVDTILSNAVFVTLSDGATLVFGTVVLLSLNARLALVAIFLLPAYVVALRSFNGRLRSATWEVSEKGALLTQEMQETLVSHELIKIFGSEGYHRERFGKSLARVIAARVRAAVVAAYARVAAGVVTIMGPALVLWFGTYEYLGGRLTLGALFAFNTYLAYLFGSANGLLSINFSFQGLKVALTRMFEILDADDQMAEASDPVRLERPRGDVEYQDVCFAYDVEHMVLDSVSFRVRAGESTAVVGQSGAGKTTLMSLLLRLYDPQRGRVELDGVDLRRLSTRQLREMVAVVPQETLLISGTVSDNIRYNTRATDEEVRRAAVMANADEFIKELPSGYDSFVGERGFNLSSGQKQRIAIARALLRRPKILIFDEATSALDSWSEQLIREALQSLQGQMTIFTIAHRLYTVTSANGILFLQRGRLIAQGTHDDLYSSCPSYAFLFDRQFSTISGGGRAAEPTGTVFDMPNR